MDEGGELWQKNNQSFLLIKESLDKYVVMLNVLSHTKEGDLDLADNVTVQLMHTDPTMNPMDIVVKKAEKKGLYQALDIASIWLTRALEESAG